jgi:hypothetical protein
MPRNGSSNDANAPFHPAASISPEFASLSRIRAAQESRQTPSTKKAGLFWSQRARRQQYEGGNGGIKSPYGGFFMLVDGA